jgi:hypothetical protein
MSLVESKIESCLDDWTAGSRRTIKKLKEG